VSSCGALGRLVARGPDAIGPSLGPPARRARPYARGPTPRRLDANDPDVARATPVAEAGAGAAGADGEALPLRAIGSLSRVISDGRREPHLSERKRRAARADA
jgi:hypothetical protein